MSSIANILEENGYSTFLPHRDGLESIIFYIGSVAKANANDPLPKYFSKAIFALDMYMVIFFLKI
jgi:hypothetical protein